LLAEPRDWPTETRSADSPPLSSSLAAQGFDNIRLVAVDEPSILALMLLGLGAIAWRSRRTGLLRIR
jgi:hypothetical protein